MPVHRMTTTRMNGPPKVSVASQTQPQCALDRPPVQRDHPLPYGRGRPARSRLKLAILGRIDAETPRDLADREAKSLSIAPEPRSGTSMAWAERTLRCRASDDASRAASADLNADLPPDHAASRLHLRHAEDGHGIDGHAELRTGSPASIGSGGGFVRPEDPVLLLLHGRTLHPSTETPFRWIGPLLRPANVGSRAPSRGFNYPRYGYRLLSMR